MSKQRIPWPPAFGALVAMCGVDYVHVLFTLAFHCRCWCARLGGLWGCLGSILGRLGRVLGASWGPLGLSSWNSLQAWAVSYWGEGGTSGESQRKATRVLAGVRLHTTALHRYHGNFNLVVIGDISKSQRRHRVQPSWRLGCVFAGVYSHYNAIGPKLVWLKPPGCTWCASDHIT